MYDNGKTYNTVTSVFLEDQLQIILRSRDMWNELGYTAGESRETTFDPGILCV